MTLENLRALFRSIIFDDGSGWPDPEANRVINAAMQHVANAINSQLADAMVETVEFALPDPGAKVLVSVSSAGWTYPRIRSVRALWARDEGGNIPIGERVSYDDASLYFGAADQAEPKFILAGETLELVQPPVGANFTLKYTPGIPDMTADTDSPGQAGGAGTADKLPLNFQPLIAAYAALLATGLAERTDAGGPVSIVTGMQQAAGLELLARRPNGGRR